MMNEYNRKDNKYGTMLTILLIVVVIAILILLGVWGYTTYKNITTTQDLEKAANEIEGTPTRIKTTKTENKVEQEPVEVIQPVITTESDTEGNTTSTVKTYKGFVMVGRIEIPKTKLNLPVLENANKQSIETSVAIMDGPGLNKVGNTTIIGHNYRNGMFFSNNDKIEIGDKIYITDTTGNKVTYIVYNKYVTTPEDAEYVRRDTNGAMEISLSTCTDDSSGRIIIWAKAE